MKLSGPQVERLRKNLFKFFGEHKLKITIEANIKTTDFLDISFDLNSGQHRPYRKDDNIPSYININSNHPKHIKQNLPIMISKRISMLSSNQEIFNQESNIYNEGLRLAGYNDKISYIPPPPPPSANDNNNNKSKRKKRNVIYFCPPWNDSLKTNLGKKFLSLIDKHFKKDTYLGKLFNRNTIKLSYSCTKNMKSIITGQNSKLTKPQATQNQTQNNLCNCVGFECPVNGECQKSELIYSCKVESQAGSREYIGATKNTFKIRWNAHNSDARYISNRHNTSLANYIWTLKETNQVFTKEWKIELSAKSYCPEMKYCNTCSTEKYWIMKHHKLRKLTNRRTEILAKCRHRAKFLLSSC